VRAGAFEYEVMTDSFVVSLALMMVSPCIGSAAVRCRNWFLFGEL
jgi:hypothetical protein